MTSKELNITKCWPRTLRCIISPKMSSYFIFVEEQIIMIKVFTVGLTPSIKDDPRFVDRHIEKVSDQWVAFRAWW